MKPTIGLDPELESRAREAAARHGIDLDACESRALEQRLRQPATDPPCLSEAESRLFLRINHGLPDEVRERYRLLSLGRRAGWITAEEELEILGLCEQIEKAHAVRTDRMTDLACLRGVTLNRIMKESGIGPCPFPDA